MWGFKKNIYMHARVGTCLACVNHDVVIDTQTWMGCNLNVTAYRNGDVIPQVTDATAWSALSTGAWCHYNNDPANDAIYGKLYNWYAINDIRGLAPIGYHVPTDAEWTILVDYLGGESLAGGKMKETGLCHWLSPNSDATDDFGFAGLPGGYRNIIGAFVNIGNNGYWWSSVDSSTTLAWYRYLYFNNSYISSFSYYKTQGLSVRLIKD